MSKTNKLEAFIDHIASLAKYEECTICTRDVKTGIERMLSLHTQFDRIRFK